MVVLITGGASGLGLALAQEFALGGARVVLADIQGERAEREAATLSGWGCQLDVTDPARVEAVVAETIERFGRLDVMVNNAGVATAGPVIDQPLEEWRRVLDINLYGVIHGVRAAYPKMIAQGSGTLVNIASLAGLCGFPGAAPYAASKGAVILMGRSLRAEARLHGVRVTTVCPGFLDTNIYEAARNVGSVSGNLRSRLPHRPTPAPVAAREIVERLKRNPELIVVPRVARVVYRLQTLFPRLAERAMYALARKLAAK